MKEVRVKVHSEVGIITNSSTTIYSQVTKRGLDNLINIVDTMLKIGGSEFKATDLFNFDISVDGDYLDDYRSDKLYDEAEDGDTVSYRDYKAKVLSGEIEKPEWWDVDIDKFVRDHQLDTYLRITPKTENENVVLASKMMSNLSNLFESFEGYN